MTYFPSRRGSSTNLVKNGQKHHPHPRNQIHEMKLSALSTGIAAVFVFFAQTMAEPLIGGNFAKDYELLHGPPPSKLP